MKLKIGDIVLCNDRVHNNTVGFITEVKQGKYPYTVEFHDGNWEVFNRDELQRIYYNNIR